MDGVRTKENRGDDGRIPQRALVGLSIVSFLGLPVMFWLTMAIGTTGVRGVTSAYLAVLAWIGVALIPSAVVGPVAAVIFWYLRKPRLTWWWLTLPFQLIGLSIAMSLLGPVLA